MELVALNGCEDCHNVAIRQRAIASPKGPSTHHFVAKNLQEEIAFVALDFVPNVNYLVLYELFVRQCFRGQGFGTQVLAEVERIANESGRTEVTLKPEPFDHDRCLKDLIEWYKARGYSERIECSSELAKELLTGARLRSP